MNRKEQMEIRKQLALRQNPKGEWEIYTTIHGTGVFRWFIISEERKNWYQKTFPEIPVLNFDTTINF